MKENSNIDSHHDLIISTISLPFVEHENTTYNEKAPKIDNTRIKILWSEDGIEQYQKLVSPVLSSLRDSWLDISSSSSISILLQSTNEVLSTAAKATNKHIKLGDKPKIKPSFISPEIKNAAKDQEIAHKNWLTISDDPDASEKEKNDAKEHFKQTRKDHRKLKRQQIVKTEDEKNEKLFTILSNQN